MHLADSVLEYRQWLPKLSFLLDFVEDSQELVGVVDICIGEYFGSDKRDNIKSGSIGIAKSSQQSTITDCATGFDITHLR